MFRSVCIVWKHKSLHIYTLYHIYSGLEFCFREGQHCRSYLNCGFIFLLLFLLSISTSPQTGGLIDINLCSVRLVTTKMWPKVKCAKNICIYHIQSFRNRPRAGPKFPWGLFSQGLYKKFPFSSLCIIKFP